MIPAETTENPATAASTRNTTRLWSGLYQCPTIHIFADVSRLRLPGYSVSMDSWAVGQHLRRHFGAATGMQQRALSWRSRKRAAALRPSPAWSSATSRWGRRYCGSPASGPYAGNFPIATAVKTYSPRMRGRCLSDPIVLDSLTAGGTLNS